MGKKLWQKDISVNQKIEEFTVGLDRELDVFLAKSDIQGSLAHIAMLCEVGLLEASELEVLQKELKNIYKEVEAGDFTIEDGIEDVHSQVEFMLTDRLGDVGKKIHSGRSRNDQVLVDLKLFFRDEIKEVVENTEKLFNTLIALSNQYKNVLLPGYTHLQIAMPSSFGLWFGAYAESLVDDLQMLQAAYKVVDKNPLGSAAGYGSSFPLKRTRTTELLGFDTLNHNVVYAQMSRGKTEKLVSTAIASIAATLGRMSMDICLYMSQNMGFISFPDQLTTGSSIMPHKKNPDVFEIMRGKCNIMQSLPNDIAMITTNLPSGYHREMQLVKEKVFPAFTLINECLDMAVFMLDNIIVNEDILNDDKYQYLYSVEVVNNMVLDGIPFRDAYKKVGQMIEAGEFQPSKEINHTHEGSIGNLQNDAIKADFDKVIEGFNFKKAEEAIEKLTS